jgi:hypothetical protein
MKMKQIKKLMSKGIRLVGIIAAALVFGSLIALSLFEWYVEMQYKSQALDEIFRNFW